MTRNIGERQQLARQVRKRLAVYLYWMQPGVRDEARARRALLAARTELGELLSLHAGGQDPDRRLDVHSLRGQLEESARLLAEAGVRIEAGTETLLALGALARTWEAQAAQPGEPASDTLRACAAQLRAAVARAHYTRVRAADQGGDPAEALPHAGSAGC